MVYLWVVEHMFFSGGDSMKNIKLMVVLLVIVLVLLMIIFVNKNNSETKNLNESFSDFSGDETTKVLLYFYNPNTGELEHEYREVSLSNVKSNMYETIINELLKGPTSPNLISTIPLDTKVNEIVQEDGKLIVDFSEEYNDTLDDQKIDLAKTISIVNTLTEIKEIQEVEIKVNGVTISTKKRV